MSRPEKHGEAGTGQQPLGKTGAPDHLQPEIMTKLKSLIFVLSKSYVMVPAHGTLISGHR